MNLNIQYIKHKAIDKKKWDSCIDQTKNGFVFGYSWYLDCVFNQWDALVLNDYDAVFPLTIKSKLGLKYLFNPMFTLELGLFSKLDINSQLVKSFLDNIPSNVRLIDYNLNFTNTFNLDSTFDIVQKKCQAIELNQSYVEIQKKYSTNLKRNLSKAKKNLLLVKTSNNVSTVVSIFKENKGAILNELKEIHFIELEKLLSEILNRKAGFIYECWLDQELLAAAAYSISNDRIIYIKGGSTQKGRELNAMHCIMDHVINSYSEQNIIFDFGGSSISQVAKFNYQFGAEDYSYLRIYRNKLPFPLNLLKK